MGDFNAVQSTIRWRAQVRSSKTIKIRQLSMIVSILRDWYKSFFFFPLLSFGSLIFSPLKSSHKVNQIVVIFSLRAESTRGLCGWKCQSLGSNHFGPVGCQEQHGLQRAASRAFRCSVLFKLFPKSPIPPHAEEIIIINLRSGRGIRYLSASRTGTIEEGSQ